MKRFCTLDFLSLSFVRVRVLLNLSASNFFFHQTPRCSGFLAIVRNQSPLLSPFLNLMPLQLEPQCWHTHSPLPKKAQSQNAVCFWNSHTGSCVTSTRRSLSECGILRGQRSTLCDANWRQPPPRPCGYLSNTVRIMSEYFCAVKAEVSSSRPQMQEPGDIEILCSGSIMKGRVQKTFVFFSAALLLKDGQTITAAPTAFATSCPYPIRSLKTVSTARWKERVRLVVVVSVCTSRGFGGLPRPPARCPRRKLKVIIVIQFSDVTPMDSSSPRLDCQWGASATSWVELLFSSFQTWTDIELLSVFVNN